MSIKKISGYTIFLKEVLGKGSYGSVYKGEQDGTKMPCAIKMLNKKNIDSDEYLKAALFSEIQVLKSVKSEHVVGFFDVMESTQNYYIVQELCDGDLEGLIKKSGGRVPEDQAIKIITEISNGFLALVREGIVHRDLKPANVMMSKGTVKIGDFGFAKKNANRKVKNETSVGTPLYMSVEILKGQPYTSKCDIWALGFIFYELTHGMTPWIASTEFELVRNIENKPVKINKKLAPNTIDFLQQCLKVKESDRISWDEVFQHPIFEGYFKKYGQQNAKFENKLKKVMADIRFMINSQNIDLTRLFERMGYKEDQELTFKELQRFLRTVNPQITSQEEVYMFQRLDEDNNGSISLKELEKEMEKNHISMRSRFQNEIPSFLSNKTHSMEKDAQDFSSPKTMTNQLQQRTRQCFIKLYKTLAHKNLTLYKIFLTYDTDRSGMLSMVQFGKILRRLDNSISEQEVSLVFTFIDTDGSNTIEFDQLNNYYCKVNGIPLAMDLPPEYQQNKMQQQNAYYQQMNNNNNQNQGGFVMGQLQNAFNGGSQQSNASRSGW